MTHRLTFFPLGNADCCLIEVADGRLLLFDYAHRGEADDPNDHRIDLPAALRERLKQAGRTGFHVVAFTHLDADHYDQASAFFSLDHAKTYQGEDRITIDELWVPAAAIVETGLTGEAAVIRAEARHRLKHGYGIRVFSRPDYLKDWLEEQGLTIEDRAPLISDAGTLVPGFVKGADGVEFFVHSPFATRLDDGSAVERNDCNLALQATFGCGAGNPDARFLLLADTPWDVLQEIVQVTQAHQNDDRLAWDVVKVPHHCSYLSLSAEIGDEITTPVDEIDWLYREQGAGGAILVSSSDPIPSEGSEADQSAQPPHRQAAAYYHSIATHLDGEFRVTMAWPTTDAPEPIVITFGATGAKVEKSTLSASAYVTRRDAPRAGWGWHP